MPATTFTAEQVQEMLLEMTNKQNDRFLEIIRELKKPSAIEARKLQQEEDAEKRKAEMIIQFGRIEEEAIRSKKHSCSHMRYPANAGRNAGHGAPRGALNAEWVTAGQALQDGTVVLICQRCSTTWRWKPDPNMYSEISQNGLLGVQPPPLEMCINDGEPVSQVA